MIDFENIYKEVMMLEQQLRDIQYRDMLRKNMTNEQKLFFLINAYYLGFISEDMHRLHCSKLRDEELEQLMNDEESYMRKSEPTSVQGSSFGTIE